MEINFPTKPTKGQVINPRRMMIYSFPKVGKCFEKGTMVKMFDGTSKAIEDIKPGEYVLGHDFTSKEVMSTSTGLDNLYKVTYHTDKAQIEYVCTSGHLLYFTSHDVEFSDSYSNDKNCELYFTDFKPSRPYIDFTNAFHGRLQFEKFLDKIGGVLANGKGSVDLENLSAKQAVELYNYGSKGIIENLHLVELDDSKVMCFTYPDYGYYSMYDEFSEDVFDELYSANFTIEKIGYGEYCGITLKWSENHTQQLFYLDNGALVHNTSVTMQLPNSLHIDLEGGGITYDGISLDITQIQDSLEIETKRPVSKLGAFTQLARQLRQRTKEGKISYDYVILDNTTHLEEIAKELATIRYKQTLQGKNYKGNDIYSLPKGQGYSFVRQAFLDLYKMLIGTYSKCLILIAHAKDSSITKNGEEISVQDISLTGKLKTLVAADMDAIGWMYRDKLGKNNVLSFKTNENNIAVGSRCQHIANKDFIISELQEDGSIKTNWDQIFLPKI